MNSNVKAIKAGYALIDEAGNVLTSFKYENIEVYDNFICYTFGGKVGFMDKEGKELTRAIYSDVKVEKDFAAVRTDEKNKYGIVSKDMNLVIPFEYKEIESIVWKDKTYFILIDEYNKKGLCYIDEQNNIDYILDVKYKNIYQLGKEILYNDGICVYFKNIEINKIIFETKAILTVFKSSFLGFSNPQELYCFKFANNRSTVVAYDKENNCLVHLHDYELKEIQEFEIRALKYTQLIIVKKEGYYEIYCLCRDENNKIYFRLISENVVNYSLEYLSCGYIMVYYEYGVYSLVKLREEQFEDIVLEKKFEFAYEMKIRKDYFDYEKVKAFIKECNRMYR